MVTFVTLSMSAFDRRRTNGPEESFAPVFEPEPESDDWNKRASPSRTGRSSSDLRPICELPLLVLSIAQVFPLADLKTGLTSQANGSAYIETQNTKIACAVSVIFLFPPFTPHT